MIPEAAVEAALSAIQDLPTVENRSRQRTVRAILEAAAPHMAAQVERELSDATRVIALLVSDAGGKVTLSRKSVVELPSDTFIETTQDVINGGFVIRAKAGGPHGND